MGVAEPLFSLAAFYQKIKQPAAAVPIYQRVIAVQEKHFGPEGKPLVETLEQCACALAQDKKMTEANEMTRRAALIEGKSTQGFVVFREAVLEGGPFVECSHLTRLKLNTSVYQARSPSKSR